jgi:hypothetical protein
VDFHPGLEKVKYMYEYYCCIDRMRERVQYFVTWVRTPPMVIPNAAPTGAPAEKAEKAMERIRDGGKACARMPS